MTNIGSLLGDAAVLMLTGMVVVFVFLTILVYLVRLLSKLVPEEAPQPSIAPVQAKKFNPVLLEFSHRWLRQFLLLYINTVRLL